MPDRPGLLLEDLTWLEAEAALQADTIVMVPIGAAAKEHGPHLLLKNDLLIAEYLRDRILDVIDVVAAPTVNYHHYPAFAEYPGSTSLRLETARDLLVDICLSLAAFGPRRFYLLNTGISTIRAIEPAVESLRDDGLVVAYTELSRLDEIRHTVGEQEGGTHADEIETSMMLYMAPDVVDMAKAVHDYDPRPLSGLTRRPDAPHAFSPSGVFGDASLATVDKGRVVVEFLVEMILTQMATLSDAEVP